MNELQDLSVTTPSQPTTESAPNGANPAENIVRLITKMAGSISTLEARTVALEAAIMELRDTNTTLQAKLETHEAETVASAYARTASEHRHIRDEPARVAYALHLTKVRRVPAYAVAKAGVLTQSKMQGIAEWSAEHVANYVRYFDVQGIFDYGVDTDQAKVWGVDYIFLTEYMTGRALPDAPESV